MSLHLLESKTPCEDTEEWCPAKVTTGWLYCRLLRWRLRCAQPVARLLESNSLSVLHMGLVLPIWPAVR